MIRSAFEFVAALAVLAGACGCSTTYLASSDRVKGAPALEPFDDTVLRTAKPAALEFSITVPDGAARALVLWLDGIDDPDDADELFDELIDHDYAVARARVPVLLSEPLEIRVSQDADSEGAAARVAATVDARLAGLVNAVSAFCSNLPRNRRELATLPRVLIGWSTGAAPLPAVAGRIDRVAAAVLVSAPANLFTMAVRSDRDDLGLRVVGDDSDTSEKRKAWIADLYLAESQLDPYRTAQFLWSVPVLQYHARFDATISTDTSEELHLRLRRPDTIRVTGKHGFFQWHQDFDAEDIREWIGAALSK